MSTEQVIVETWPKPSGYANGRIGQGKVLHIGGQVGWAEDHTFPSLELVEQMDQALANVITVLHAAQGTAKDIASMTIFVTDIDAYRAALHELRPVWQRHVQRHYPAMALVAVIRISSSRPPSSRSSDRIHRVARGRMSALPTPTSFALELAAGVVTITLDRPTRLNALTFEVYEELAATFEQLDRHDDVRAVVITGRGRGFCSGGDQDDIIKHLLGRDTPALLAFTRATGRLIAAIRRCKRPVMPPGINGVAVGAGAVIAHARAICGSRRRPRSSASCSRKSG